MSAEPAPTADCAAPVGGAAWAEQMAQLQAAGAPALATVQWHFLQALARRAATQSGPVRGILEARLDQGLQSLAARLASAQDGAAPRRTEAPAPPEASLGGLLRLLAHSAQDSAPHRSDSVPPAQTTARPELRAVRAHRATWSQLSMQRQLAQALQQSPRNAGPINSHMLVLRSLELMRSLSPDYLQRFMSYADSLLSLDQHSEKPVLSKASSEASAAPKKAKARRAKPASPPAA